MVYDLIAIYPGADPGFFEGGVKIYRGGCLKEGSGGIGCFVLKTPKSWRVYEHIRLSKIQGTF